MDFSNTTILITGGASGIGLAVAEALADVADEAFWNGVELGPLDHVVINAGVAGAATQRFALPPGAHGHAELVGDYHPVHQYRT